MKVIIIGGGKTLYFICRKFTSKGYEVVIINRNREECIQFARQLAALVICGDGSDIRILKDAGAMGADVVLAVTPNDQDNLIICQLASLQFGVPRTLALANDPDNTEMFEKLGVPAFSTTHIVCSLIEQQTSVEQIANYLSVGEGRVNITEIIINSNSPVAGKMLKDIDIPGNALIAVIIRDNSPIIPRGADDLQSGDRVVLVTLPENHGRVVKVFTGENR